MASVVCFLGVASEKNARGGGKEDAAALAAELRDGVLEDFKADVGAGRYGEDFGGVVGAVVGSG